MATNPNEIIASLDDPGLTTNQNDSLNTDDPGLATNPNEIMASPKTDDPDLAVPSQAQKIEPKSKAVLPPTEAVRESNLDSARGGPGYGRGRGRSYPVGNKATPTEAVRESKLDSARGGRGGPGYGRGRGGTYPDYIGYSSAGNMDLPTADRVEAGKSSERRYGPPRSSYRGARQGGVSNRERHRRTFDRCSGTGRGDGIKGEGGGRVNWGNHTDDLPQVTDEVVKPSGEEDSAAASKEVAIPFVQDLAEKEETRAKKVHCCLEKYEKLALLAMLKQKDEEIGRLKSDCDRLSADSDLVGDLLSWYESETIALTQKLERKSVQVLILKSENQELKECKYDGYDKLFEKLKVANTEKTQVETNENPSKAALVLVEKPLGAAAAQEAREEDVVKPSGEVEAKSAAAQEAREEAVVKPSVEVEAKAAAAQDARHEVVVKPLGEEEAKSAADLLGEELKKLTLSKRKKDRGTVSSSSSGGSSGPRRAKKKRREFWRKY